MKPRLNMPSGTYTTKVIWAGPFTHRAAGDKVLWLTVYEVSGGEWDGHRFPSIKAYDYETCHPMGGPLPPRLEGIERLGQ